MNKKNIILSIIFLGLALIGIVGVTYAFFNYTRTGNNNTIRVGNIYFNSEEGYAINLTNMFPMAGRTAENANLDTLTIAITGNTNYPGGEEFVVSVEEIDNGYNNDGYHNIRVPISYFATYEANEGKSIGTLSNDYWNERNNASDSIYYLPNHSVATPSKKILVGYIPSGEEISGTLTIKAYIDSSKIAISDTYSETGYVINPNMTENELNACASFVSNYEGVSESVARAYCDGSGNIRGWTFDEDFSIF